MEEEKRYIWEEYKRVNIEREHIEGIYKDDMRHIEDLKEKIETLKDIFEKYKKANEVRFGERHFFGYTSGAVNNYEIKAVEFDRGILKFIFYYNTKNTNEQEVVEKLKRKSTESLINELIQRLQDNIDEIEKFIKTASDKGYIIVKIS